MGVVGRRGDRQNPADRLDPIRGAMIVELRLGKIRRCLAQDLIRLA
jgi:hypothetical protein